MIKLCILIAKCFKLNFNLNLAFQMPQNLTSVKNTIISVLGNQGGNTQLYPCGNSWFGVLYTVWTQDLSNLPAVKTKCCGHMSILLQPITLQESLNEGLPTITDITHNGRRYFLGDFMAHLLFWSHFLFWDLSCLESHSCHDCSVFVHL